ncbi:MAG: serine protease Do [Campylobacterota bacterium]|nr:serine protease Do [Campylobacterota bacterium]
MKKTIALSSILMVNLFAGGVDFNLAKENPARVQPNTQEEILSFNKAIEDSMKSVVNISAKKTINTVENFRQIIPKDPFFNEFFNQFFHNSIPIERVERSLGSGVILSKDGYIVTNSHVISNSQEITVMLANDTNEYSAKLIGKDEESDLAVIKIEAKNLKPIKMGYSDNLKIGDMVFAIGNPFGVGETVTQGIISALNKNKVGINRYENFIQTDASINPGNSGGALIDSRGALIGINSAIITKSGGNNGVGFAIPVDMVKDVAKKLIEDGKISRGFLGISIDDLSKNLEPVYNHKSGALVLDVNEGTPAEKYGIKRGDLIYEVNGKTIKGAASLSNTIASFKPNEKVKISLERDKKNITIEIVLAEKNPSLEGEVGNKILGGLSLGEITAQKRTRYRLAPNIKGVLIEDVEPNSKAEKIGFLAGDVIIQIENDDILTIENAKESLKKYNKQHKRVYVNRYGRLMIFAIK